VRLSGTPSVRRRLESRIRSQRAAAEPRLTVEGARVRSYAGPGSWSRSQRYHHHITHIVKMENDRVSSCRSQSPIIGSIAFDSTEVHSMATHPPSQQAVCRLADASRAAMLRPSQHPQARLYHYTAPKRTKTLGELGSERRHTTYRLLGVRHRRRRGDSMWDTSQARGFDSYLPMKLDLHPDVLMIRPSTASQASVAPVDPDLADPKPHRHNTQSPTSAHRHTSVTSIDACRLPCSFVHHGY
jgi:hypothetical protein